MFNINIAPGTKILLRNTVKTIQGMLSLSPQNISILGGKVTALYEKWETNNVLAKFVAFGARRSGTDSHGSGPPPWISFGQKMQQPSGDGDGKSFKSLGASVNEKTKEPPKENIEFVTTRNEAIAEAIKIGTTKIFGGGNRQLVDHNVKKILDKGYTEEQAKYALKMARNNLERAMSSLKRRNVSESEQMNEQTGRSNGFGRDRGVSYNSDERNSGTGGRGGRGARNEIVVAAKPSGKLSLFDFLEDKIKIPESSAPTAVSKSMASVTSAPQKSQSKPFNAASNYNSNRQSHPSAVTSNSRYHLSNPAETNANSITNRSKFENNISSSFASRQKKDEDIPHSRQTPNYNANNNNSIISNHRSSKWNDGGGSGGSAGSGGGASSFGLSGKGAKSSFPPFPGSQQPSQHFNRQKNNGNDRPNHYESSNKYQPQSNHKYVLLNPFSRILFQFM